MEIVWDNLTCLKLYQIPLDGCVEVLRQVPLLEFCLLDLSTFKNKEIPPTPKKIVRLMHLRKLHLLWFSAKLLTRFVDVMELPSLEEYHSESLGTEIAVDGMILLLNRSGSRLKRLILWLRGQPGPGVGDLKKLLNAVPCLQNIKLHIYSDPITTAPCALDDLLQNLSSSPRTLEGNIYPRISSSSSISGNFIYARNDHVVVYSPHLQLAT